MKVQEDNELYDEINVVPMLDLAYVLLVIFIIMTTASVQGIRVNLPKASNTPQSVQTTDQGDHDQRKRTDFSGCLSGNDGRAENPVESAESR